MYVLLNLNIFLLWHTPSKLPCKHMWLYNIKWNCSKIYIWEFFKNKYIFYNQTWQANIKTRIYVLDFINYVFIQSCVIINHNKLVAKASFTNKNNIKFIHVRSWYRMLIKVMHPKRIRNMNLKATKVYYFIVSLFIKVYL